MRAVDQSILHDPDTGSIGNCMQAAIASVLDLELDDVPHFALSDEWDTDLDAWMRERGLLWVAVAVDKVPDDALCVLQGISPRGVPHVVVGRGLDMVHDPHPSRTGLRTTKGCWLFLPWEKAA